MIQTATPLDIEYAANHPDVHHSLGVTGCIEMTHYYVRPKNTAFCNNGSVILLAHQDADIYEIHFLCLRTLRGKELLTWTREVIKEMFTTYKASAIVGTPPRDNRAVRCLGTALGFTRTNDEYHTDTLGRVCCSYELRFDKWEIS